MHHRSLLPSVAKPLHLCTIRAEAVVTVVLRIMESLFVLEVCYTSAAKDECKPWSMLQPRVETELWNTILAYFGCKACFGAFITPNSMLSSHVTNIFCEPIQLRSWQSRQSKPYRRRATRVWAPAIGTGLSLLNCWDWTRLDYQRISGMMNLGFLVWHLGLEFLYPSWSYACAEWYVCPGLLRSFMRMMTESPSDTAAWHCMATLFTVRLVMCLLSTMLRCCSSKPSF